MLNLKLFKTLTVIFFNTKITEMKNKISVKIVYTDKGYAVIFAFFFKNFV